jgi:hypothetical protein
MLSHHISGISRTCFRHTTRLTQRANKAGYTLWRFQHAGSQLWPCRAPKVAASCSLATISLGHVYRSSSVSPRAAVQDIRGDFRGAWCHCRLVSNLLWKESRDVSLAVLRKFGTSTPCASRPLRQPQSTIKQSSNVSARCFTTNGTVSLSGWLHWNL